MTVSAASSPKPLLLPPPANFPRFYDAMGYLIALIVALGEFVRHQFFYAWLPLYTNGDASQHVWWMHRWRDPQLFQNDLLFDYFADPSLSPIGHRFLYWTLAQSADPVVIGEWLPLPMLVVFCLLLYRLGKVCGGGLPLGGMAAVVMFAVTGVGQEFIGGFARCHSLIVLAAVGLGWAKRDGRWVGGGLIYGALMYPPITALGGALTLLIIAVNCIAGRSLSAEWRRWNRPWLLLLGGLLAVGLLGYFMSIKLPEAFGPTTTAAQARMMPEFQKLGRNVFFVDDPWDFYFMARRSGLRVTPTGFFVSLALLVGTVLALPRAVPRWAWAVLGGSLGMWLLAHLVLFSLYLPSRYTKYSLPLFMMVWAAVVLPRLLPAMRKHRSLIRLENLLRRPVWALPLMLLAGLIYGQLQLEAARGDLPTSSHPSFTPGLAETLAAIESLPKDTLIGSHPYDADLVPLLAKRSVLVSYETTLSYHLGFYDQIKERTEAVLKAVYADEWEPLQELHDRYGVDVLLVNNRRYAQQATTYFRPFDALAESTYARGKANGFEVFKVDPRRVLFQKGNLSLIWLGPIDEAPVIPAS